MLAERIVCLVVIALLLWSNHWIYEHGVLDGYLAARWDARTPRVKKILRKWGLSTRAEREENR